MGNTLIGIYFKNVLYNIGQNMISNCIIKEKSYLFPENNNFIIIKGKLIYFKGYLHYYSFKQKKFKNL